MLKDEHGLKQSWTSFYATDLRHSRLCIFPHSKAIDTIKAHIQP